MASAAHEELLRTLMAHPEAQQASYHVTPPGDPLIVFRGAFKVYQGTRSASLRGKIELAWLPEPELRFEGEASRRGEFLDLDHPGELRTGSHGIRGPVLVVGERDSNTEATRYSGIFNPTGLVGQRRSARSVRFQLVNFPPYIARSVRHETNGAITIDRGRLTFRSYGLRIEVDQVHQVRRLMNELRRTGGFATTHVGTIRSVSGGRLTYDHSQDIVECLRFFTAFLAGRWVGPVLTEGDGKEAILWRNLGAWKLTPGDGPRSWFPDAAATDAETLFGQFRRLWQDTVWCRALRMIVYWYVQANAESGSVEAAIVAACIPLELIAWVVVVERARVMSASTFGRMPASERLRVLLEQSGIPTAVPRELGVLRRSALARRARSGPRIIADVRNALVHPTRHKRKMLSCLKPVTRLQVKELALTYLELTLLSALGYQGRYCIRAFSEWKGDHIKEVPWV